MLLDSLVMVCFLGVFSPCFNDGVQAGAERTLTIVSRRGVFNLVRLVKHRGAERNNGEGAVPGSIAARGTTPSPLTRISRDRNQP